MVVPIGSITGVFWLCFVVAMHLPGLECDRWAHGEMASLQMGSSTGRGLGDGEGWDKITDGSNNGMAGDNIQTSQEGC